MATVHYDTDCRDGFDDAEDGLGNPFAVADSEHSDVVRAATEYDVRGGQEGLPKAGIRPSVRPSIRPLKSLHRIAEVRQRQGVTLRNVARRLGVEMSVVRRQEQPDCDVRVSDLMKWQEVLEVPVSELLVESEGQLSGPVLERARMV
ncbi:MAG: helix-turn-helix transcriptional regulator, partial [Planctomycetota bacterium]